MVLRLEKKEVRYISLTEKRGALHFINTPYQIGVLLRSSFGIAPRLEKKEVRYISLTTRSANFKD